jgi:hypothetical protein
MDGMKEENNWFLSLENRIKTVENSFSWVFMEILWNLN